MIVKKFGIISVIVLVLAIIAGLIVGNVTDQDKTPVATKTNGTYIALGDSVAAGVGLLYDSDTSACDRTDQAYAHIVAQAKHYAVTNLACSGATLPAGISGVQDVNNLNVASQLSQLFGKPKPNLVTLTIGANDAGWTQYIAKCYTAECGSEADTNAVTAKLLTVKADLESALQAINDHYQGKPPTVVVTGYHQLYSAQATQCLDVTGVSAAEQAWVRDQQAQITTTIQQATQASGFARFAAVDFSGHELCTDDSWVQGVSAKDPYHPTAEGQQAYAKAVETALK